jgi:hypothetical protein
MAAPDWIRTGLGTGTNTLGRGTLSYAPVRTRLGTGTSTSGAFSTQAMLSLDCPFFNATDSGNMAKLTTCWLLSSVLTDRIEAATTIGRHVK